MVRPQVTSVADFRICSPYEPYVVLQRVWTHEMLKGWVGDVWSSERLPRAHLGRAMMLKGGWEMLGVARAFLEPTRAAVGRY